MHSPFRRDQSRPYSCVFPTSHFWLNRLFDMGWSPGSGKYTRILTARQEISGHYFVVQ